MNFEKLKKQSGGYDCRTAVKNRISENCFANIPIVSTF